jgi:hypothetical protein
VTVVTAQQKRESEEAEAQKRRSEAEAEAQKRREAETQALARKQREEEEAKSHVLTPHVDVVNPHKEVLHISPARLLSEFEPLFSRSTGTSRFLVTEIKIRDLRAGDRVEAACRGCHGTSKLGPVTARGSSVVFRLRHLQVTAVSRITFKITRAGYLGRSQTWRFLFHPRRAAKASDGCLLEGTTTRTTCPGE